jgi:predicted dehydrogenase
MEFEPRDKLRIGVIGSGFIAQFHLRSMLGVRNVEVTGVYSRSEEKRQRIVDLAAELGLGRCTSHHSLQAMLRAGDVDAVWILSPNDTRLDVMRIIHAEVTSGRSRAFAVACEKPLGRTVREAREMLRLAEEARLNHGYLENQVFSTAVIRGKEIVWRRAASATAACVDHHARRAGIRRDQPR